MVNPLHLHNRGNCMDICEFPFLLAISKIAFQAVKTHTINMLNWTWRPDLVALHMLTAY